jgi:hypothetical protein
MEASKKTAEKGSNGNIKENTRARFEWEQTRKQPSEGRNGMEANKETAERRFKWKKIRKQQKSKR